MKTVLFVLLMLPVTLVQAFDECAARGKETQERYDGAVMNAVETLGHYVIHDAPAEAFDLAEGVTFRFARIDEKLVLPVARIALGGKSEVIVPEHFFDLTCKLVSAWYIYIDEGQPGLEFFHRPLLAIASCKDQRASFLECVLVYADALASDNATRYMALPEFKRNALSRIVRDAQGQFFAHELAHHIYKHFPGRGDSHLSRIDREFQADFYAIQWALNRGSIPAGLGYFFMAMGVLEIAFDLSYTHYEDPGCRARNANDVMSALGIAPIVLLRLVANGNSETTASVTEDLKLVRNHLAQYAQQQGLKAGCGRLKATFLAEAHAELIAMMNAVAKRQDLLQSTNEGIVIPASRIDEIHAAAEEFARLNGRVVRLQLLSGRLLADFLGRAMLTEGFALTPSQQLRVLESLRRSGSARSLGSAMANLAYGNAYGEPAIRRQASREILASTRFEADSPRTWLHLSLIALLDGQCGDGLEFGVRALRVASKDTQAAADAEELARIAYEMIQTDDARCIG